jgi:hypothetical protein
MSEGQEIQASREEVEEFVGKLKGFYGGLQSSAERAMLETILQGAQGGETGGYGLRGPYTGGNKDVKWDDLIGWIEEQGEDDTQGFRFRFGV